MGARLRRLGFASYADYLASPLWAAKRAQFLAHKRAVKQTGCAACGSDRETHVHHLRYTRLGCEWLGDLVLLCGQHHERVHRTARRQMELGSFTSLADATVAVIRGERRVAS